MKKFPLSREAFPPAPLSVQVQEALEKLADRQLALAERQLDQHVQQDNSEVDKRRWKPLKTRECITVFRERSSAAFHRQCHSRSQIKSPVGPSSSVLGPQSDEDWPLPQLLAVGTLEGTLEDVVYGIHTPTAAHVMAKAVISDDEVVDAQVLQELKGPTIAHPFRFLGLKWLVKAHPAAMGAVVLPRDIVYVEHTGLKTRADGSKLGHFLIHSVNLPQYPELRKELGLVRARVSSCVLLRQRENDSNFVDVFMTGRVAAQGRVLDSLALLSTANGLTYFWKASVCAQRRKLAWRLQHKRKLPPAGASVSPSLCPLCTKGLDRAFSSPSMCEMCGVRMCSRCSVTQKLLFPGAFGSNETHLVAVELCTPCISRTTEEDPLAIARQEIRAGQYGALTSPRSARYRNRAFNVVKQHPRVDLSASAGPPVTKDPLSSHSRVNFAASVGPARMRDDEAEETVTRQSLQALDILLKDSKGPTEQQEDRWDELTGSEDEPNYPLTPTQRRMTLEDLDPETDSSMPLWARMSALQVMAESTYHYSKKTTEKTMHLSHSHSSPILSKSSSAQP
ncbi:hypothetical protein PC129_g17242 [Phytophthora cactorum]|uniref:FYVE-type domain-containing protein n=1 Tax=Phytophthora cactorum TaxID=29920 RepID=A0A329S7Y5_9STRA|nr:hypothetical protein Pcac1_g26922 [Phytophthora cactorum]KAG2822305.1 hypothetical protein PC111_g10672 [Phytophthora cactorum]KAG2827245.1 hypothetical protein PC112_g8936 [Phytophthora cactorum]KAG2855901.1 hypothetical protein PC113_g12039 [Phytophthora cactorum]KAG2902579.1 hypothetical protein PC114_g12674 [Phytophthora cactorum]